MGINLGSARAESLCQEIINEFNLFGNQNLVLFFTSLGSSMREKHLSKNTTVYTGDLQIDMKDP